MIERKSIISKSKFWKVVLFCIHINKCLIHRRVYITFEHEHILQFYFSCSLHHQRLFEQMDDMWKLFFSLKTWQPPWPTRKSHLNSCDHTTLCSFRHPVSNVSELNLWRMFKAGFFSRRHTRSWMWTVVCIWVIWTGKWQSRAESFH